MSLLATSALPCPSCGQSCEFHVAGSVNADRRPDLREAILDHSLQSTDCPSCGEEMRLEPMFSYLDVGQGLWIAAFPARRLDQLASTEHEVAALFEENYGKEATKAAQEIGVSLRRRLTFGWPALREKLYLRGHGIDDVTVEMLKLDLLRRLPEAPLRPGVDLRLVEVSEEVLGFVWIDAARETVLSTFEVSRGLLSNIEKNPEKWDTLRQRFAEIFLVDMQRFYLPGDGG